MMSPAIRLLIVDDRPRSRQALLALLATCPEIAIVGQACDGREAVRLAEAHNPDVVLMDVRMPVMDGIEATRRIKAGRPEVDVIILTLYGACRSHAMAAGATAFLVKGGPPEELLEVIKTLGTSRVASVAS